MRVKIARMGHAHHFLSRLDRVSDEHVELALSLYRDEGLLRFVLQNVRLPEGAERVALSMADATRGPFLIVTREGRFVTCLGEGMATDLPVVPRGQLDALSHRAEVLRARMAEAARLVGPDGHVSKLVRRVREAGNELSREEFMGIASLQPMLRWHLLRALLRSADELEDSRKALRDIGRPRPKDHALLKAYWRDHWALGHLYLLLALDEPHTLLDEMPDAVRADFLSFPFSWSAVRQGTVGLGLRGSWAAARFGKVVLPIYKREHATSTSITRTLCASLGLVALGSRHSRLRAEVLKALSPGVLSDSRSEPIRAVGALAHGVMAAMNEAEHEFEDAMLHIARDLVFKTLQESPLGRERFPRAEDVPRDVVLPMVLSAEVSWFSHPALMTTMLLLMPHAARLRAEDFYLRREHTRGFYTPWTPAAVLPILAGFRDHYGTRRPVVAPARPGRNDPCTCGSGQKYKKCCADRAAA